MQAPKLTGTFSFLLIVALLFTKKVAAQLPVCPNDHFMYLQNTTGIYNYDGDLPVSGTNPSLNSIALPGGYGFAVSPNLNSASPAVTFYTIVNSKLWYYDGSAWVNTNHSAGTGANLGGGGGYIYIYNIDGDVYRYNGTGDAIFLVNISTQNRVADVSVDCSGNFYALNNSNPQSLQKV